MGEFGFRLLILTSSGLSLRKQAEIMVLFYTISQGKDSGSYLPCVPDLEEEFENRSPTSPKNELEVNYSETT